MNPTSQETREIWEQIAVWWDEQIGEGNVFQTTLIMPATDRLLEPREGQSILDIACGNGNYARRLGAMGASVVACDFCAAFLQCARERTGPRHGRIEYCQIDATDADQLLSLGQGRFDSAVCSMAMMDMTAVQPLLCALPRLLKAGGRFVFSLPHPCFSSNDMTFTANLSVREERLEQVFGVEIRRYLSQGPSLSVGIINQPRPHYFFHRPLSAILSACFSAGWVVDGLEEPAYPTGPAGRKNAFSWQRRPEIPPAMVLRVRSGSLVE
jgi:SAM-dependent methyltransferase